MDQFDDANNGTTISARRFAQVLKKHDNEVRVIGIGHGGKDRYIVEEYKLPIFDKLVKSQGMAFGRANETVLRKAIAWADVVHFLMPFALSIKGQEIAKELGVAHTAAFHVQPENITYSIGLGKLDFVNRAIYKGFRDVFYNRFTHIHCPSYFIANELKKNGYRAKLHVISNGIEESFVYRKLEKPNELKHKFVILMVGRLSNEKRQDVLIDAIARCKYAEYIQLILAGQGPKRKSIIKYGQKLKNRPIIGFYSKEKLQEIIAMSDLYVHAADVEIEAIACIEAFSSGLVPVIANSEKSATPQFAMDERSLFKAGDSAELSEKIEYWIEHKEERKEMEKAYSEYGKQFNIEQCVFKIEKMFEQAVSENETR